MFSIWDTTLKTQKYRLLGILLATSRIYFKKAAYTDFSSGRLFDPSSLNFGLKMLISLNCQCLFLRMEQVSHDWQLLHNLSCKNKMVIESTYVYTYICVRVFMYVCVCVRVMCVIV